MARKLNPEETEVFAQELAEAAEARVGEELSLETFGERRDAIMSMSPELRAFFDKDPRQLFSGS